MRHATLAAHALTLLCLWVCANAQAQVAVPPLRARVTDLTATLSTAERASLEEKLRAFEARKGSQIAVLVVPSTAPEDLAQFGIRVAEAWKLGRKGVDDGAILLVAKDDRSMRIEVGYGLEGALTDALTKRIVDETIAPRFRAGDYAGGVNAGVDQMMRVIDGEPLPEPDRSWSPSKGVGDWLGVVLVVVFIAGSILRRILGRFGGALAAGGLSGLLVFFITSVLPMALLVGVLGFGLSLMLGGFGGPGGWSSGGMGGWSGGRGGWGGGSGGGFSGGGGGFGGGGASGRW